MQTEVLQSTVTPYGSSFKLRQLRRYEYSQTWSVRETIFKLSHVLQMMRKAFDIRCYRVVPSSFENFAAFVAEIFSRMNQIC